MPAPVYREQRFAQDDIKQNQQGFLDVILGKRMKTITCTQRAQCTHILEAFNCTHNKLCVTPQSCARMSGQFDPLYSVQMLLIVFLNYSLWRPTFSRGAGDDAKKENLKKNEVAPTPGNGHYFHRFTTPSATTASYGSNLFRHFSFFRCHLHCSSSTLDATWRCNVQNFVSARSVE